METWPSGRRHIPAKDAYGLYLYRGFESHRLRQNQIKKPPLREAFLFVWTERWDSKTERPAGREAIRIAHLPRSARHLGRAAAKAVPSLQVLVASVAYSVTSSTS